MMIHGLKMIIPLHSLFLHNQMASRSAFSCLNCCKSVLIGLPNSSLTSFKYVFHIEVKSDLAPLLNSQNYQHDWGVSGAFFLLLCLVSSVPVILRHLQCSELDMYVLASGLSQWIRGKESACIAGDMGSIPGLGRSPGGGCGSPSSILAWRIPWTEKLGGLKSIGSQRVGHNWSDWAHMHSCLPVSVHSIPSAQTVSSPPPNRPISP